MYGKQALIEWQRQKLVNELWDLREEALTRQEKYYTDQERLLRKATLDMQQINKKFAKLETKILDLNRRSNGH